MSEQKKVYKTYKACELCNEPFLSDGFVYVCNECRQNPEINQRCIEEEEKQKIKRTKRISRRGKDKKNK